MLEEAGRRNHHRVGTIRDRRSRLRKAQIPQNREFCILLSQIFINLRKLQGKIKLGFDILNSVNWLLFSENEFLNLRF